VTHDYGLHQEHLCGGTPDDYPRRWLAVWGNGTTMVEAGVLSTHETRQEAQEAADDYARRCDNPAAGAWVRQED
jgi:hypothetical protein